MKLIHCSDLHLDSPMESNLTLSQARKRNMELIQTFQRLVDYARTQQVTAVLLAGDLFDSQRISAATADLVFSAMAQAPEIDFLYLRGNHDESRKVFAGRTLPENLKLFSRTWTCYTYGSVTIAGIEPDREGWSDFYDGLSLDPRQTNVVMLHGQVSTQPGEEQICLPRLKNKGIHYLALGHLHTYHREQLDPTGIWCYSGCLEGRGFDECGPKGFVLVELEDHAVSSTFVPFARRTLWDLSVDISGRTTIPEILRAMEEAAGDLDPDSLVKFTLTGTYTPDTQKDLLHLQHHFASRFFLVKLKDCTRLAITPGDYRHDLSLKGEFVRLVLASDLPPEEQEQIICAGIQALSGEAILL